MNQKFQNPFEYLDDRLAKIESRLTLLTDKLSAEPQRVNDLGSISLAEEITGLARQTIYQLVSSNALPNMKRGRKLYFSRTELEKWVRDGKRKTVAELTEEVHTQLAGRRVKC